MKNAHSAAMLVKKHGRFGEFIGCSGYPKCKYTRPIHHGHQMPSAMKANSYRGSAGKGGRGRRAFFTVLALPDCDFTTPHMSDR